MREGNVSNGTTSDGIPSETVTFESMVAIFVPIVFGCVVVSGLTGNVLVIVVVAIDRKMKSTTNLLITSLAFADLLFIVICVPFTATRYAMTVWPFGTTWCKIHQYVSHVTVCASVYSLVLMSLDRYLAVCHPIRSMSWRTERNASLAILLSWSIIATFSIPVLVEHEQIEYVYMGQSRSDCINAVIYAESLLQPSRKYHGRIVYGCLFLLAYLLPLGVITVVYGCMLRRVVARPFPTGSRVGGQRMQSGRRRVTRMIVVVVAVFALCWLPAHVVFVISYFTNFQNNFIFTCVQVTATCLAYLNSCINPFIYTFLSGNFRKSFYQLMICRKPASASTNENVNLATANAIEQDNLAMKLK